jgi:hypothetical protein
MNYGLMVSLKVESKLELVERHNQWATAEETMAYRRCLAESLEELDEKPWVDGNIRIGDYILLSTLFLSSLLGLLYLLVPSNISLPPYFKSIGSLFEWYPLVLIDLHS